MAMEWSNVTSLALIREYRKHSVLWNTKHDAYYSKPKKLEAWTAIARTLRLRIGEVRQKMNSLLGSFRRERSKIRRGGQGNGYRSYTSNWFAFNDMLFLLNRNEEPSDKIYLDEVKLEDDEENMSFDSDSNHLLEEELNEAAEDTPPSTSNAVSTPVVQPPPPKRPKTKHIRESPVGELPDFLFQEECATYANYVTSKLQKYSDRTRACVQNAISNILFQADLGKYDDLPSPFAVRRDSTTAPLDNNLGVTNDEAFTCDNSDLDQLAQLSDAAQDATGA